MGSLQRKIKRRAYKEFVGNPKKWLVTFKEDGTMRKVRKPKKSITQHTKPPEQTPKEPITQE